MIILDYIVYTIYSAQLFAELSNLVSLPTNDKYQTPLRLSAIFYC